MAVFAITALVIAATFLVAEFVVRYEVDAWPFDIPHVLPSYLSSDESTLRWRFSPTDGRNSLGLRNREIGDKSPGNFRILFLGDSLFWSGQTSSGDLHTAIIERNLNAAGAPPPSRHIEVINAGVPGYTTYQELEFLKVHGLGMQPDLVILGFVFNDLHYPYLHKSSQGKLLDTEPESLLHEFDTGTFPGKLFAHSYTAHQLAFLWSRVARKIAGKPLFTFERSPDLSLAWKPYGWDHTPHLLAEMRERVTSRGAKFMVLIFPVIDQVDDALRAIDSDRVLYPQKRIKEVCTSLALTCLDLTESLRAAGGKALFRNYIHLNKKGNDVVAAEVTRYLQTDPHLVFAAR